MIKFVVLSDFVKGQIRKRKLPAFILVKLQDWIEDVELRGLNEVRKTSGYHDEPCKGALVGHRSIRLSKGRRAYYRIFKNEIEFIRIEGIDKHEY